MFSELGGETIERRRRLPPTLDVTASSYIPIEGQDLAKSASLAERGQYVAQDSALALSQVMHDGRPDKDCLAEIIHGLDRLRLAGPDGPQGRLTIFGDMTVSLCRNGDFEAALELERIWNELTRPLPFFTVCSYPTDCFEHSAARNQLPSVCAEHSAVTC